MEEKSGWDIADCVRKGLLPGFLGFFNSGDSIAQSALVCVVHRCCGSVCGKLANIRYNALRNA